MLCRMDKLPALEVVADNVMWGMGPAISGDNTLVAVFAHVSIRTADLLLKCEWELARLARLTAGRRHRWRWSLSFTMLRRPCKPAV